MKKVNDPIINKILRKIGNENLVNELITKLSPSEISTLQIAIDKELTKNTKPSDLLEKYVSNRFVKPSQLSPIKVKKLELAMLEMAGNMGFSPVLLSPVSLLGCCSAIAKVDQNNIVSSTRGLEVLSDSTNSLAVYLARGIKDKTLDNSKAIHLASTCRVTRAQSIQKEEFVPHFSLLALVSSGMDTSSYTFEKECLVKHLKVYLEFFRNQTGFRIKLALNPRSGYTDQRGFIQRIQSHILAVYPELEVVINKEASDNEYYKGLNFKIYVNEVELVDGGFVDWTQKLLENKKERLLISGAGIDLQFTTGLRM